MPDTSDTLRELTATQRKGDIAVCAVCVTFVAMGVFLIFADVWFGWIVAGFFGLGAVFLILDPWLPKSKPAKKYRAIITDDSVKCEYPKSGSQSMRWNEITRVVLVTTSDGPWVPDQWLFFINANGEELPIPTEAEGFERFFRVLESKLPGFDFEPFIAARTADALYECWPRNVE